MKALTPTGHQDMSQKAVHTNRDTTKNKKHKAANTSEKKMFVAALTAYCCLRFFIVKIPRNGNNRVAPVD